MSDAVIQPLVVIEGLDVSIFPLIEEAEEYLAGLEITGRAYFAFDAEGRALKVEGAGAPGRPDVGNPGKVRIELAETEPNHAADLWHLLRDYLQACGERVGAESTLSDLILRCRGIHLYRE